MTDILKNETVAFDEAKNALVIIDQTKLPGKIEMLSLTKQEDIHKAIYLLQVRGAPAIGVAAAIGVYLAAREISATDYNSFYIQFKKAKDYLASARPTAVNLFWALDRMERVVLGNTQKNVDEIKNLLKDEAVKIREEDIAVCRAIGENALSLIKDGLNVTDLTSRSVTFK
jgi:methylthioribose-1-phosphate isomerase